MASVSWSKSMAEEIIKAGYRQLTKKFHPDAGGSHDEMIVLKVTAEHLQGVLNGTKDSARTEEPRRRWDGGSRWENKRRKPEEPKPDSEIPLEKHSYGWFMVKDTICVRQSEKAIQVKFPGVPMPQWLPKSQLHVGTNMVWEEDDKGLCVFSTWIAKQKGWA